MVTIIDTRFEQLHAEALNIVGGARLRFVSPEGTHASIGVAEYGDWLHIVGFTERDVSGDMFTYNRARGFGSIQFYYVVGRALESALAAQRIS